MENEWSLQLNIRPQLCGYAYLITFLVCAYGQNPNVNTTMESLSDSSDISRIFERSRWHWLSISEESRKILCYFEGKRSILFEFSIKRCLASKVSSKPAISLGYDFRGGVRQLMEHVSCIHPNLWNLWCDKLQQFPAAAIREN